MKSSFAKNTPLGLGLLLLFSGLYKVAHPGDATYALMSLDLFHRFARPTVVLVTAVELYLGIILTFRIDVRFGLRAATIVLFAFTLFLWYLSSLAHPPSCGCMGLTGVFKSSKQAALFGLVRNCAILWCLKWSVESYGRSEVEPHHSTLTNA
jgi:hypothetical protein